MKNIYKYLGFAISLALVALWSCEEDYEAPTAEPNHAYITTSFGGVTNRMQVNSKMTVIDLSRGVKSREWTFDEGTTDNEYNSIETATEAVVRIRYTNPGVHTVRLTQEYNGEVYIGSSLSGAASYDTTFTVTVVDSIRANFTTVRNLDASLLTNANGALNVVEGGREITFTQNCTGEPTTLRWILSRKDGFVREVQGETATTKLNSVGNYDLTFIASSAFGADTLAYEDYIKIVPSTDPMILESITADKKIYLTYSRDVAFPGSCDPSSITLTVTNDGDPVSGVEVTDFALNQQLPNIIELTLNQEIYNTDVIKISYNDQIGNLVSADGMKINSFTDQDVIFTTRKDLFEITGYDGTVENSTNANWAYAWWGGVWGMYNTDNNVTTVRAHSGSQSLYFNLQAGGGAVLNFKNNAGTLLNTVPVVSGKIYEGSFWLYIESQGASSSDFLWMLPNNGWASMMGVYLNGSEATGVWKKVTMRYEATSTEDLQFIIRGNNPTSTVPLQIYIDDMKFEELEKRP